MASSSGDGSDEVPIEYNGPAITVGFNAKYFLDVLGALGEDEVELGLSGELDPAVVKPVSERLPVACTSASEEVRGAAPGILATQ